jgi:hypothetical protein
MNKSEEKSLGKATSRITAVDGWVWCELDSTIHRKDWNGEEWCNQPEQHRKVYLHFSDAGK